MIRLLNFICTVLKYISIIAVFYSAILKINIFWVCISAFMIVINSTILNIVFEKMLNEKDIKLYVIDTDTFDYEHLYNNLDI